MTDAAYRIPDGLNHTAKLIQESKNVASLSLTKQMQDFINFAEVEGYKFELFVRTGKRTKISGPLRAELKRIGAEVIPIIP